MNSLTNVYAAIEKQRAHLEEQIAAYPENPIYKQYLQEVRLAKKKLNLAVAESKRQRARGIPIPNKKAPGANKRLNNYFTKKAQKAIKYENEMNAFLKTLNNNVAKASLPNHKSVLEGIAMGFRNAANPAKVGGKSRKASRRKLTRRRRK